MRRHHLFVPAIFLLIGFGALATIFGAEWFFAVTNSIFAYGTTGQFMGFYGFMMGLIAVVITVNYQTMKWVLQ